MNNQIPSQPTPGSAGIENPSFLDSANVPSMPAPEPQATEWVPEDSLSGVVRDVERFAREWIGRIRQLIHRSSQLVERESLLVGAIAKLDQQKTDWTKRIEEKESGIREQAKLLSEAWIEVEAERRRTIQGARAAANGNQTSSGVQSGVANPVTSQPVVAAGNSAAAVNVPPLSHVANEPPTPVAAVAEQNGAVVPTEEAEPESVSAPGPAESVRAAGAPIIHDQQASLFAIPASGAESQVDESRANRIEEFKRMQRSIRNR